MADPVTFAAYFILKTVTSLAVSIASDKPDGLSEDLIKSAGTSVYYDILKSGGQKAWSEAVKRIRTEYYSDKPLNHDLQKAVRKAQLEATLSACEACWDELCEKEPSLLDKIKNLIKSGLSDEQRWLKDVIDSLNQNLVEVKSPGYIPPNMTENDDILRIADSSLQPGSTHFDEAKLIDSLKETTISEIRIAHPPNYYQDTIADSLADKIRDGWTKTYDSEKIQVDWYKLLCELFNEEYKENPRVTAALQKIFFQDAKGEVAIQFRKFTVEHFEKLGGQILSQLKNIETAIYRIEGKQDFMSGFLMLFREENYAQHEETQRKQNKAQESLDRIEAKMDSQAEAVKDVRSETAPQLIRVALDLKVKVYGRDTEKDELLKALCGETAESQTHGFALIVAPSAFGKTYLLTKALEDVTDGAAIKPAYAGKIRNILLLDCRQIQSVLQIVGEFNSLLGSKLNFDGETGIKHWLDTNLFPITHQTGNIWLILDNFESWLDGGYHIIDEQLHIFLNALLTGNHRIRGIVLSQSDPEGDIKRSLNKLDTIGAELYKGLPEADALKYLQTEGAAVNLHLAPEHLLVAFLERVAYIPQALSSLVGYLSEIPDYTFVDFMADASFWDDFDKDEHDADALKKGVRPTKALLARQIEAQSPEVQLLLQALTFFNAPTPREALELLFESKAQAGNPISRLHSHNLAAVNKDSRGTIYYELHAYFREQTRIVLAPVESIARIDYAVNLFTKGVALLRLNYFIQALALWVAAEKIFQHLFDQGNAQFEMYLGASYLNKGNALDSLGRLSEAIIEYDKSTAIYERLVNVERREELAKELAGNYLNKGVALANLSRLSEAIIEYDKAITICERLVNVEGRAELANNLAMVYLNKGVALRNLDRVGEAIIEYDKVITIRERLVNVEGRAELANDLAMVYLNKGVALDSLDRVGEAIIEYDKAITIRERLVNVEGRAELANDLAMAYLNKGATLDNIGRLSEAIIEYDKAITIRERLVNVEGREELANDLAMVYLNKGNSLDSLDKGNAAADLFAQGIVIWENCLVRNEIQILPNLCKGLRIHFQLLLKMENWQEAAQDTVNVLIYFQGIYEDDGFSEHFKHLIGREFSAIIQSLRGLPEEKREIIYQAAGKWGAAIKTYVDYNGE